MNPLARNYLELSKVNFWTNFFQLRPTLNTRNFWNLKFTSVHHFFLFLFVLKEMAIIRCIQPIRLLELRKTEAKSSGRTLLKREHLAKSSGSTLLKREHLTAIYEKAGNCGKSKWNRFMKITWNQYDAQCEEIKKVYSHTFDKNFVKATFLLWSY